MKIQPIKNITLNNKSTKNEAFKGNTIETLVSPGTFVMRPSWKLPIGTTIDKDLGFVLGDEKVEFPQKMIEYRRYPWENISYDYHPSTEYKGYDGSHRFFRDGFFFNFPNIPSGCYHKELPLIYTAYGPQIMLEDIKFDKKRMMKDLETSLCKYGDYDFNHPSISVPQKKFSGLPTMTEEEAFLDVAEKLKKVRPIISKNFELRKENIITTTDRLLRINETPLGYSMRHPVIANLCDAQRLKAVNVATYVRDKIGECIEEYLMDFDNFRTRLVDKSNMCREIRLLQNTLSHSTKKLAEATAQLAKLGIHP